MCKTTQKDDFPARAGENWFLRGGKYQIALTHQKYLRGDGEYTMYVSLRDLDAPHDHVVVTHSQFIREAEREEPLVERFITPDKFLRASPCNEGLQVFARVVLNLRLEQYPSSEWTYRTIRAVMSSSMFNEAYSLNQLYKEATKHYSIPDSWLLFLAKALNLVPQQSKGPDRAALKRLLGIRS